MSGDKVCLRISFSFDNDYEADCFLKDLNDLGVDYRVNPPGHPSRHYVNFDNDALLSLLSVDCYVSSRILHRKYRKLSGQGIHPRTFSRKLLELSSFGKIDIKSVVKSGGGYNNLIRKKV